MMSNRLLLGLWFILNLTRTAYANVPTDMSALQIKDEQRICQRDDDCQTIRTSCLSCCPDLKDSVAVNKKYTKMYVELGTCTEEHIKSCGVPECGLESPSPVAVCRSGHCAVVMEFQGHE
jgi:hypothetical protein